MSSLSQDVTREILADGLAWRMKGKWKGPKQVELSPHPGLRMVELARYLGFIVAQIDRYEHSDEWAFAANMTVDLMLFTGEATKVAESLPDHPLIRQARELLAMIVLTFGRANEAAAEALHEGCTKHREYEGDSCRQCDERGVRHITAAFQRVRDLCVNDLQHMEAKLLLSAKTGLPTVPTRREQKAKAPRRKKTATERPLTERQRQTLELYAKHQGKLKDIARELGITHPTAYQHLQAAWHKLPHMAPKKTPPTGKPRALPKDRRGQPNL